ncbi:MAG: sulfotransferase [Actinobacteria bacterium]|nr:sulfotransferase [Actinomycetota bacterium]
MSRDKNSLKSRSSAEPTLPNFLVIGAMKAGTTSLYHYLRDHPQVFMPETKEVNFFNPLRNWRRGVGWYEDQFCAAPEGAIAVGEASTSYTKFPWIQGVPERIAAVLGDVRLIYVVRHPVERMRSQYLHHLATGQEWRPIAEAFVQESMYLNISRYAFQLDQFLPYVPRDRVLVLDSRDLRADRVPTLRRIFEFLEVEPNWVPLTVEQEFLRSVGRQMKPPSLRAIRRVPKIRTLSTYVPQPLKTLKHRLTSGLATQELDVEQALVPDELQRDLRRTLRTDVERLRAAYLGDDFDGWGIG